MAPNRRRTRISFIIRLPLSPPLTRFCIPENPTSTPDSSCPTRCRYTSSTSSRDRKKQLVGEPHAPGVVRAQSTQELACYFAFGTGRCYIHGGYASKREGRTDS